MIKMAIRRKTKSSRVRAFGGKSVEVVVTKSKSKHKLPFTGSAVSIGRSMEGFSPAVKVPAKADQRIGKQIYK